MVPARCPDITKSLKRRLAQRIEQRFCKALLGSQAIPRRLKKARSIWTFGPVIPGHPSLCHPVPNNWLAKSVATSRVEALISATELVTILQGA